MSKLYVKLDTDAIKTSRTARGHKYISGKVTYDHTARLTALEFEVIYRDDNSPLIRVNGKKIKPLEA